MAKRIVWLALSCLIVVALVLASCGPAEEGEEEEAKTVVGQVEEEEEVMTEEVVEEGVEMVRDSLGRLVEKPRYGGVLTLVASSDPVYFDEVSSHVSTTWTLCLTNEGLLIGDWAKGPAGTGEASFLYAVLPDSPLPLLAESWEMPDEDTMVFHIRRGVHFHDKPPTNGREMTADDVVFSHKRLWEVPTSYLSKAFPWEIYVESITAPDKWTVIVKSQPGRIGPIYEFATCGSVIVPPEAVEEYGDLRDWSNSIGTGPFMLSEYIPRSSMLLERNPNYWQKDPFFPDNTLPYVDGVKFLIIPDASTRLAALRTGKIDHHSGLTWEVAENMMETNPELEYSRSLSAFPLAVYMRIDKQEQPWFDIKVRHALSMAIDRSAIVDEYYGGNAEAFAWPIFPLPDYKDAYTPLDELPESIRELLEYHPDKAKVLLAEAGYPTGFEAEVLCLSSHVDLLAIVKSYWSAIGVDLQFDVREAAVYTSARQQKKVEQLYTYVLVPTIPYGFHREAAGQIDNVSMVDDPLINKAADDIALAFFNKPERAKLMKDIVPHMIDLSYLIALPAVYNYTFWQPWLENYHGEYYIGSWNTNRYWATYIWLNQDLKRSLER